MTQNRTAKLVRRAVKAAPFGVTKLAIEARVSSASLYAWANGIRNPPPEKLRRLADVLERRGGELQKLADELRKTADAER